MEFKIAAGKFRNYIATVSSVCNGKQMIPIYNNILMEHDGSKLCLSATNLHQSVYAEIKDLVGNAGNCTVPAKKLLALLGSLNAEEEISVSCDDTKGFVDIKTATGKFSLLGLPAVDFAAVVPEKENENIVKIKNLQEIINTCSNAISKDDGRIVLTGLLLEIKDGFLNAIGTDGKRMAVASISTDETFGFSAIIPAVALPLIAKLSGDEICAYIADQKIVFVADNMTVVTKLIAGNYPNWKAVVPASFNHKLTVDAEKLVSCVKVVSTLIDNDKAINMLIDNNKITFSASSEYVGVGLVELDTDFSIEFPFEVRLNPQFVLDALAGHKGSVNFCFNSVNAPICVERSTDCFTILMPMRAK